MISSEMPHEQKNDCDRMFFGELRCVHALICNRVGPWYGRNVTSVMDFDHDNKRILLIEDDPFLSRLLTERLARENLNFDLAVSGEEGLKKAQKDKPALVLLDLVLPGIDGYEVLKRMKEDSNLSKVPVFILSNLGQDDEIKRGLDLGAVNFLIKANFDLDEIIEKIKQALPKVE